MLNTATLSDQALKLYASVTSDIDDEGWWEELHSIDHALVETAVPSLGPEKTERMIENFRMVFDSHQEVIQAHIIQGYFTTALSWFDLLSDFMNKTDKKLIAIAQAMPDEYLDRLTTFLAREHTPSNHHQPYGSDMMSERDDTTSKEKDV